MENRKKDEIAEIEKKLEELRAEREKLLKEASEIEGVYLSAYEIRPAGRHLFTIGKDLIQDQYAAIVELVKNCYDADSPDALVVFRRISEEDCLEIQIEDHGHGMSTSDIINKWLVPSTDYKQNERKSRNGRVMQGRKGIGRYAASILGDDLRLQTVDSSGNETELYFEWGKLAEYQYLDQIQIPIDTAKTDKKPGTTLTMRSKFSQNDYWTKEAFRKLRFELRKLIPPQPDGIYDTSFEITLKLEGFCLDESDDLCETIIPYPILDFYDYRISGNISAEGSGAFVYENKKIKNSVDERISVEYGATGCGALFIDIRVYDRDKEAIDQLVSRGIQSGKNNYITKQQARQLLNEVNGVGVYRNGFRIRPLGDADFDWLKLNEQRVQNPSLKLGSNQVVGYVYVESEEISGLEEKSARDGLKDNAAYQALKDVTRMVIMELEQRRFVFRRKMELSNPTKRLGRKLDGLYDYTPLKNSVSATLKNAGMSAEVVKEIEGLIDEEEQKKNKAVEEIKYAVAMYQGQATLGKIVNIILHEGRRPLNYFKNQIPNLHYYGEKFAKKKDEDSYNEIVRLTAGIANNASIFVALFSRLDPLAAKRRETKKEFLLHEALEGAISVFDKEFKNNGILVELDCPEDIKVIGWYQDIYTILVNLLDNSRYWLTEKKCEAKIISIAVKENDGGFTLDYVDSGPGISNELLESGVIFEPEFTTKPQGTGLGLAIAGEAAMRNELTLTAVQRDQGVHFILDTDKEVGNV